MDDLTLINNTSVYRNPAPQSPLQGANVLQPAAVYSKIMLRTIELSEADFVFDALATERTMPSNNGSNEIVFKRMLSLAAHTQPLVEGIPPASDQGRMVAIKASTTSYGRVMKFTDKVNWAVVDPLISEYTRQLSLKIPETKDLLAQQALLSECQTYYACKKTKSGTDADVWTPLAGAGATVNHILQMSPDCVPTIDEFRKIVLSMEAAKVRPYQGSNFLVLASSAVIFDLITDKRVKEFMKYTNSGSAYTNDMVIDLFSLAFKKAKTIKCDNTYTDGDGNVRYLYFDATGNGVTYSLKSPLSSRTASSNAYPCEVDDIKYAHGAVSNGSVAAGTKTAATATTSTGSFTIPTSAEPLNVHHSFVVGEDCLFRIGIEGHNAPQFIKKELGSAGTEDPLNQRQSIGWKIDSLGYKVPNPDAVQDYMSCPSQYRINLNARPDLKNQFTDYEYGYMDSNNKYYSPEQVVEQIVWDGTANVRKYYVKGTTTAVNPVKMTQLVKTVSSGRINYTGKKAVVVGALPNGNYALKSDLSIRFTKDQIVHGTTNTTKWYIKGLADTANAEVVELPATEDITYIKSDGTGTETRMAIAEGTPDSNRTGDSRID